MVSNVFGNGYSSQNNFNTPPVNPMAQGTADITGPFGVGQGMIQGVGTVQIGPYGVSTSVPWAPGFSATPGNTVNGLGLASPFATQTSYLNNLGMNSFGQENPYNPLIGTPVDLNNGLVMAMGSFGGYQNQMSPYSGSGLPQSLFPDGSFGFGGPGGSQPGNIFDSANFGGTGMGAFGGNSIGGQGGLDGGGNVGAAPTMFGNPTLFSPVPSNVVPGVAQSFTHQGDDLAAQYNVVSDGVAKLFFQGNATQVPRQSWNSGSILRSPLGIYETGVGWAGGHANAGLLGTQATGMAWAMVRNPINPGMIVSYSNPHYNNYNFNQGFTNG